MAIAAELIDAFGGEVFGVEDLYAAALCGNVIGPWAVAGFAAHAWFGRLNALVGGELQRARGMALEAA